MGVWYDTTSIVTNVRNFPRSRGYVVGRGPQPALPLAFPARLPTMRACPESPAALPFAGPSASRAAAVPARLLARRAAECAQARTRAQNLSMKHPPTHAQTQVGILKSFLGLSASIFTTIYMAAFAPDAVTFLLVMG
jgi:hypothetical protein